MPSVAEIVTAAGAMVAVVGISVAATVYVAEDGDVTGESENVNSEVNAPHRYVISDAYYLCRDHIDTTVSQQVRNINVDSHSSRYDEGRNDNLVFIDLELIERQGGSSGLARAAKVVCRVSAANNEIKSFHVKG